MILQREVWSLVKSKSVSVRRQMPGVIRAEMFGQLTSGLEAAWTKLKGEGFVYSVTSITQSGPFFVAENEVMHNVSIFCSTKYN